MESDSDSTANQQRELRDTLEQQGRELLQLAADRQRAAGEAAAAQRESKLQRRLQQRAAT